MAEFASYYLQLLLLSVLPLLGFGLLMMLLDKVFCGLVGYGSGRPFFLISHAVSIPLREVGHLIAAVLFLHRVEDFKLFDPRSIDGEFGFVEHSYNPRNPIAVFGNFAFALMPALLGLFAALAVVLSCFHGVLIPFTETVENLGKNGAGVSEYLRAAVGLLPAMYRDSGAGLFAKIAGSVALMLISLGVYVSLADLSASASGIALYGVLSLAFAGITALFDSRVRRLILMGLRTYATGVIALFLVLLVFAAAMVALAFLFFLVRSLLGLDRKVTALSEREDL